MNTVVDAALALMLVVPLAFAGLAGLRRRSWDRHVDSTPGMGRFQ